MTPETLNNRINELQAELDLLKSAHSIPFEIENAFRERLEGNSIAVSSKGADTEDVSVDEGGISTYSVLNDPDIFLEVMINGTTYYIPAFT
jgi:hypothetical protein